MGDDDVSDPDSGDDLGDSDDPDSELGADDTSDGTDDSTADDSGNSDDKFKNLGLMNDFSELYYHLKNNLSKVERLYCQDIIVNSLVDNVKKNLDNLRSYVYAYIVTKFNKNTYVQNLYAFNYFIEAYNLNIEMLRKIRASRNTK